MSAQAFPRAAGRFRESQAAAPDSDTPPAPYAALDLGTNACRMLVAEPAGARFRVIDSFSKPVQLGRGLERHGTLSPAAIERTIRALKVCRRKLDEHGVRRRRLVATEACRRARNADAFIDRIRRETGLTLEIIPPEEEARLAVISCASLVSARTRQLLVVDIGGGSTELVWIDLSDVPPPDRALAVLVLRGAVPGGARGRPMPRGARIVDWISVPVGVLTLRDLFRDVQDEAARFALMSCHFEERLESFGPYRDALSVPPDDFQIVGTSGTMTTVAASHLGLRRYDRTKVDGLRMTAAEIEQVIRAYLKMGPEGRRADPRIGVARQGLILSGVAILQALLRVWPTDRLNVADRGLREGALYAMMCEDGVLCAPAAGDGAASH